ncbi:type VI secretion system protein TssL, long form [Cupriavidus campinensis]
MASQDAGSGGAGAGTAVTSEAAPREEPGKRIAPESPVDLERRLSEVRRATNPLMEAARPLLRMLADMPASMTSHEDVRTLRELLAREMDIFQTICERANLHWTHMAAVRYCLCTALDEAANRTRWGGGGVWARNSLLIAFEGENDGGEKFFLLIGRMAADPQTYIDVLEILYRILGLGFEGRYSVIEDGRRHLEQVRHRLAVLVAGAREAVPVELSPRWTPAQPGRMRTLRSVPPWSVALVAAVIVFALFGWYKYQLLTSSSALQARILDIPRETLVVMQRLRLSVLLKDEIARGLVSVNEDDRRSIVVFKGDSMFLSGQSEVRKEMYPILEKVAKEVARVGGKVSVEGHTDNQRIRSAAFPNNQVLSEKRGAFVARILESKGTPVDRITVHGRGDTQPVSTNSTPQGRSSNRRVEVVVTQ